MNNFLTASGTTTQQANDLTTAITNKAAGTHGGVDTGIFASNIAGLNTAIETAGSVTFFDNVNTTTLSNSTITSYQVLGLVDGVVGGGSGAGGYDSLLDWANDN